MLSAVGNIFAVFHISTVNAMSRTTCCYTVNTTTMAAVSLNESMDSLIKEIDTLKRRLEEERQKLSDVTLMQTGSRLEPLNYLNFKTRRVLKGNSKILCCNWSSDRKHIVSSGQDGKVIVWDAFANTRNISLPTGTTWVMTCAFSPSSNLIAYGGMDNKVSVYPTVIKENEIVKKRPVAMHTSTINCCLFPKSDFQILTGSSDGSCALWDVETCQILQSFYGHLAEVTCMDYSPGQTGNLFATGSTDKTLFIWDWRIGTYVHMFGGHTSDVNSVKFHPAGDAVVTGSDDATCRLFDMRADRQLAIYAKKGILFGVNSLDFTLSGRILLAGYSDYMINIWDTLKCVRSHLLFGHENRISCVRVSPDGTCFATSSWDSTIRIWA